MSTSKSIMALVFGQHKVRTDGDLVNLNDLHIAAGSPENKEPYEWYRQPGTIQLIDSVAENLHTGKPRIYKVSRARVDRGGGTWAHKLLAVDYAGYLSPDFKARVNDTFLRVQEGDTSVILETLDNQSHEEQKRTALRVNSKVVRNTHTDTLQAHGVTNFGQCTNATYYPLFGGYASDIRKTRNLPAKANIRDALSLKEMAAVMLAETMADEVIDEKDLRGNRPCSDACFSASVKVASIL